MSMSDMKLTKKESKEMMPTTSISEKYEGPEYPYGLMITLDKDSLKKLNLDASKIQTGKKFTLTASCQVVAVSSRQSFGNGGGYESVELQITKMQLEE